MKRPKKSNRKKIEAELDRVCSQLTLHRDKMCKRCGSTRILAAHHCFGRRHMSVRWDLDNLICLCWPCHRNFAHGDPLGFATWFEQLVGGTQYAKLSLKAHMVAKRTEFDLAYILSERKKQLEGLDHG